MTTAPPKKFMFDTVFQDGHVVSAPRPKRHFTAEDLEQARAEGYADGERSSLVVTETAIAASLSDIAAAIRQAIGSLSALTHEHKVTSAELSLVCARRIAAEALDRFPHGPVAAALEALAGEIAVEPRLIVRANPDQIDRLNDLLNQTVMQLGLTCDVVLRPDPGMPRAAFAFDWGEGKAQFDPVRAEAAVVDALTTALAAAGPHDEMIMREQESRS
jgi:flagellar assembly protein FliH